MVKVNVVFDEIFEDADIISVPECIAATIESLGQVFLDWIPNAKDNDYWTVIAEKKYAVAETDGFVKWLNTYYCSPNEKAYIIEQHTNYCPLYKTINF